MKIPSHTQLVFVMTEFDLYIKQMVISDQYAWHSHCT